MKYLMKTFKALAENNYQALLHDPSAA